jgi:hypothetical protein
LMPGRDGGLIGTTGGGGGGSGCPDGCGTVYELKGRGGSYAESILYTFENAGDGSFPNDGLVTDATGALYGTTYWWSPSMPAVFYKLTPRASGYAQSVLLRFATSAPVGQLTAAEHGVFYGIDGGGWGSVFMLAASPSGQYGETFLYNFQGPPNDGATPVAPLLLERSGTLYGTTTYGGGSGCAPYPGCGTFFKLTPTASGYRETILYRFQGGTDGAFPGTLIRDRAGALYGASSGGGGGDSECTAGCGTIFKFTPTARGYTEAILYRFATGDLATPTSPTLIPSTGDLYGSAERGFWAENPAVYKLTPSKGGYVESNVYVFAGPPPNHGKVRGNVLVHDGALFMPTPWGGAYDDGAVFKVDL